MLLQCAQNRLEDLFPRVCVNHIIKMCVTVLVLCGFFPVVHQLKVLCCPHLVNRTHDARSICQSSGKCGEDCRSGDRIEKHTHTLYASKGGGSLGAAGEALGVF